jgi:tetratricopeptide (TPR) repeat protein
MPPPAGGGLVHDPFVAAFSDDQLMEKLAAAPAVGRHMADPGFMKELQRLHKVAKEASMDSGGDPMKVCEVGRTIGLAGQKDPRIMQAMMALQGQDLIVEESDLKRAEEHGDMRRREPVQLEQMQLVKDISDPEQARLKGNEYFKLGEYQNAIAHYEHGVTLLRKQDAVPAAAIATLLSNSTMCLLKLKWPDRAKKTASKAIAVVRQAGDDSFDQSKLFYRRALASEQLKDYASAADDMARALQQAKRSELPASELQKLQRELNRLKKLKESAEAQEEKKKAQKEGEEKAADVRMQGASLENPEARPGAANPLNPSGDYLAERDWTHWTRAQVAEAVKGLRHTGGSGCILDTVELLDKSKVECSITSKKGVRALYYEMDLEVKWRGRAGPRLRPREGSGELDGVIRVYNIAHDTKFELGGDENTSYIYALGWDQRLQGEWVEDLSREAAELFDLIAAKVEGVVRELQKK